MTIKKSVLTFEEIKSDKVTTETFTAELEGTYEVVEETTTAVKLAEDAFIKITPGTEDWCLFNFFSCAEQGLTARFSFKFEKFVENTYYLASGAESVEGQGLAMLFRFGQMHVILATETEYWFVSIEQSFIQFDEFTWFDYSFTKQDGLSVYVNNVLVGRMVQANQRVISATGDISKEIYIGKASVSSTVETQTEVTVSEVQTYNVSREVLVKQGYAVVGKSSIYIVVIFLK